MANRQATKTAAAKPASTDFDFGSLTPVEAEAPKIVRARKANPFVQHLTASKDNGTALAVTVPTEDAAKQAKGMLDRAAEQIGCGVSKQISGSDADGWTVTFQARERRAYSPRKK